MSALSLPVSGARPPDVLHSLDAGHGWPADTEQQVVARGGPDGETGAPASSARTPAAAATPARRGRPLSRTYRGVELRHWPSCVWRRLTLCRRYGHVRGCNYLLACSHCAAPWLFDGDDDPYSPYR